MAEQEKKEFTIIEAPDTISKLKESCDVVVESTIGRAWGDKDKGFKVYFPVPIDDEMAKERYNLTIQELVEYGVQKLSTQVDYTGVLVDGTKEFNPDMDDNAIQTMLQDAADNYQTGTRKPGKAKKDKETLDKLAQLAAAQGITKEEYVAQLLAKHGG